MCNDMALAQRICDELHRGNTHAVLELMQLYGKSLEAFTRSQVKGTYSRHMIHYYGPDDTSEIQPSVEDLVQEFWKNKILTEKVVCSYQGNNGASLKTFFFRVMMNLIMEHGRQIVRRKKIHDKAESIQKDLYSGINPGPPDEDEILSHAEDPDLVNDAHQQQLNRVFVRIALEQLSVRRPRDAKLIFLFMEGLTYREIAQRELSADSVPLAIEAIKKRENAIRKQYTREKTGSHARFAEIYMQVLNENEYEFEMISNMPILRKARPLHL